MPTPHTDASKLQMKLGSYRFNPAPFMTYNQESLTTDAGERIADSVSLSFTGTLLNLSDVASGDSSAMIALRDAMINALSGEKQEFQVLHHLNSTSAQGTPIMSGIYPRVQDLTFDEGTWTDRIGYSFTLAYETNEVSGMVPIESYSDNWEFQESAENLVIRASHSVNAKGINTIGSGGGSNSIVNARNWVNARMGVDRLPTPSGFPFFVESGRLGGMTVQSYRTESVSLTDGTVEATEDIVLNSGLYAHNYTLQSQKDDAGITTITLNGNIEGMGRFDVAEIHSVSGWTNQVQPALAVWAASGYTALGGTETLNVTKVQSLSATNDSFRGRVGYSVSYNDDPLDNLPSGIAEFSINKQITLPIRKIVGFEIPSRILGSIIHDIGTPTNGGININGTAKGVLNTQLTYVKEYCEDQLNVLRPNVALYNELWINAMSQTENVEQKTFSFNVTWAYTDNLANVQSASGDISF